MNLKEINNRGLVINRDSILVDLYHDIFLYHDSSYGTYGNNYNELPEYIIKNAGVLIWLLRKLLKDLNSI